ncbi:hypothetical protein GL218_06550 [Daldinia childiae]|uniref:uncharacterized protein n=1 Tax=Daldinia childiae TaxID=326645 RepID=UPI001444ECFE|nr:uncharacterized protein GL218_06550 [Daldinia childiae]KAF3056356.1 hypothetical protein GL218_06550 [Daldinia childiae]
MASYNQLKEPTGEDYTLNFDVGELGIPLDNEPSMSIGMYDQVIDFTHQTPNEIDIAYPEHMLNKHIVSETCKSLEILSHTNRSNLASPVHNPDHTQVGNTSDYERYHAKFFGMNSEPDSEDSVPEPVQEPEGSQYPEACIDPRLLMYDPAFWVCTEQADKGPNLSSVPQSSTSGLLQSIQAMEPLLAQQSWVSYVAPAVTPVPCTKPASPTEPTSYTGLTSFTNLTSNTQSMNPVSCPKPVSHPESVSHPAPVSYPESVSYVGPVSYPEPISYPGSASPPEPMPYTEAVFQPQPQPLEGDSSRAFRLRPDPIVAPTIPLPNTSVQKRKYESFYFDRVPATQYGQTVKEFISQHLGSKTPHTEPVVNSPSYNQTQMSLSPQSQEQPSKKAKASSP